MSAVNPTDKPGTAQGYPALSLVLPSLGVGLASGAGGLAYGSVVSILIQSPNPRLYTTVSGIQWFTAGTTFFFTRSWILSHPLVPETSPSRILASGFAGSVSGAVIAKFLPKGAFLAGTIGFGAVGLTAQAGIEVFGDRLSFQPASITKRLAAWSPMRSLTDNEYESILQRKLLKVEAEISLLDDQIQELERWHTQQGARGPSTSSTASDV